MRRQTGRVMWNRTDMDMCTNSAALPPALPRDFAELLGRIEDLGANRGAQAVIALYTRWVTAKTDDPCLHIAWFNLGAELSCAGDLDGARIAYESALRLHPGFSPAAVNLGLTLERAGDIAGALGAWSRATQPDTSRTLLLNHQARLLEKTGRLVEAEQLLRKSLATSNDQPDAMQHFVHIRQKLCLWPALDGDALGLPAERLAEGGGPLATLALFDDVAMQTRIAADWIARKTSPAPRLSPPGGYRHAKLRIGYLSSDFCRHAMSFLIAELFERHDRAQFEVFGYCSTIDDGSAIRARVLAAFDHHRAILALSDEAAARAIRADEIDILVDLNGLTQGSRLQLLRYRPAPVQATYLGFVGPVPLPELDYLFCDDIVVPPASRHLYQPPPLSIAPLYQANDRQRDIAAPISRAELGLPDDAFIFCCFSNHYKITPALFACWMRILARAERSLLWLAADLEASAVNLRGAASAAGIDPARLIFAPRTDPARYMARLAAADLFLDTFPYNAGTVASDALRMALPLVTRAGESFASRMAASLLTALGATGGIASDFETYEEIAVSFATDPAAYAGYKAQVSLDRWQATIGDIDTLTKSYEKCLRSIALQPGD
jgi:predicted O-linked N-acetylglucosamine transferase (SPINDLY family)